MQFGGQSETGAIRSILLKHPRTAWQSQEKIDAQWSGLNYLGRPEYTLAMQEYERFVAQLAEDIPEIHFLPTADRTGLDSLYVRDCLLLTDQGIILGNMGKEARRGEPAVCGEFLKKLGIPIQGTITPPGKLEGGDIIWLDQRTLAIGVGYRSNSEGIQQLRELAAETVDQIIEVPLVHWRGPDDVLHLMSLISPIDQDLAVVYSRLLTVPFRDLLLGRGIKLIEVPEPEYPTMGGNILALAPRRCLMLAGNPRTKRLLEESGVEVIEFVGSHICLPGSGGPTCLTRPLLRE